MAKKKETPKERRRRYAPHSKLRSHGYTVMARRKTVKVPSVRIDSLSEHKAGEYVRELAALGYNIQTHI